MKVAVLQQLGLQRRPVGVRQLLHSETESGRLGGRLVHRAEPPWRPAAVEVLAGLPDSPRRGGYWGLLIMRAWPWRDNLIDPADPLALPSVLANRRLCRKLVRRAHEPL